MRGHSEWLKIIQVKYPKKSSVGPNGQFWPDCGPHLCKLISEDLPEGFFSNFAG